MLENMRLLRKSKGLSMKKLGEMVGVAEVTISTYETGKSEPSLSVLCAIADILGVTLDELVRGKEKEPPTEARERLEESTFSALASLPPQEQRIARAVLDALIARQG